MPVYRVVAEFEDMVASCRRKPGELIEVEGEREDRMLRARVIAGPVLEKQEVAAPEKRARAGGRKR